jgi:sporulation protein YlmC with PRC-barrel domain
MSDVDYGPEIGPFCMSDSAEFAIGAEVVCEDGDCGELRRVIVDPIKRALTHLVVEPKHRQSGGRLVPIDLVDTTSTELRLRCTMAQFAALEEAEETQFLEGAIGQWGYGQNQMLSLPFFRLGDGGMDGLRVGGIGGMGGGGIGMGGTGRSMRPVTKTVTYDKVPVGEVAVRRGDHVHATDGNIGRVHGLVVDPSDYHVTHVLLEEGHLWAEKEVSIPISAVSDVDRDGVHLNLTKDEVRDLPAIDIDRHD